MGNADGTSYPVSKSCTVNCPVGQVAVGYGRLLYAGTSTVPNYLLFADSCVMSDYLNYGYFLGASGTTVIPGTANVEVIKGANHADPTAYCRVTLTLECCVPVS